MTLEEVNTMKLYGTFQRCFDGLTQYGAQCAADGRDTSQLRRIAMDFAETCGIDYDYIKEAFVLDDLGRRFDDAVFRAAQSGTAPEMTEKMKADTLAGLNVYMEDMASHENMEHWIEECRNLSRTMLDEWSRAKPGPEINAERGEEMPGTGPEGSRIRPLSPAKARDFGYLLALPHTDAERDWLRERLELLSVMESIAFSAALSRTQPETAKDTVNVLLDSQSMNCSAQRRVMRRWVNFTRRKKDSASRRTRKNTRITPPSADASRTSGPVTLLGTAMWLSRRTRCGSGTTGRTWTRWIRAGPSASNWPPQKSRMAAGYTCRTLTKWTKPSRRGRYFSPCGNWV